MGSEAREKAEEQENLLLRGQQLELILDAGSPRACLHGTPQLREKVQITGEVMTKQTHLSFAGTYSPKALGPFAGYVHRGTPRT